MVRFETALDGGYSHSGFAWARFVLGLASLVRLFELYHITFIVLLWGSPFNCSSTCFTLGALSTIADVYIIWIWLWPTMRVLTLSRWTHTSNDIRLLFETVVNGSRSLSKDDFPARILHPALCHSCARTCCTIKSISAKTWACGISWLVRRFRPLKLLSSEASRRLTNVLTFIIGYLAVVMLSTSFGLMRPDRWHILLSCNLAGELIAACMTTP